MEQRRESFHFAALQFCSVGFVLRPTVVRCIAPPRRRGAILPDRDYRLIMVYPAALCFY